MTYNLTLAVAEFYELEAGDKILTSRRNHNILRHYQREVDAHHMSTIEAVQRAVRDIMGHNYKPECEQRTEIKF